MMTQVRHWQTPLPIRQSSAEGSGCNGTTQRATDNSSHLLAIANFAPVVVRSLVLCVSAGFDLCLALKDVGRSGWRFVGVADAVLIVGLNGNAPARIKFNTALPKQAAGSECALLVGDSRGCKDVEKQALGMAVERDA